MFHLANKLYLCHENTIDTNKNRIVISSETGRVMHEVIEKISVGKLLNAVTNLKAITDKQDIADFFSDAIDFSIETDKPLYIYADMKTLAILQLAWFNLIFRETNFETCKTLFRANIFKYDMFYKGRFSSNNGSYRKIDLFYSDEFLKTMYDEMPVTSNARKRSFFRKYGKYVSVEYLLASYVYNNFMKKELKENIVRLIRKDLENHICELKEIFVLHFTTRAFRDKLCLEKEYDILNINEVLQDKSKYAELFMSGRLFSNVGIDLPSSTVNKNFIFENVTEEDIKNLKEFEVFFNTTLGEDGAYKFIESNINKLDFIDIINGEFTDERLEDLLDAESSYIHAAGSFFSPDLETVNNYLIEHILNTRFKNDRESLKNMIIC